MNEKMSALFGNSWVWLAITIAGFGLCALLPVVIKDEKQLRRVNLWILVPVSLILMLYAYPMGLEVFRRLALYFR